MHINKQHTLLHFVNYYQLLTDKDFSLLLHPISRTVDPIAIGAVRAVDTVDHTNYTQ